MIYFSFISCVRYRGRDLGKRWSFPKNLLKLYITGSLPSDIFSLWQSRTLLLPSGTYSGMNSLWSYFSTDRNVTAPWNFLWLLPKKVEPLSFAFSSHESPITVFLVSSFSLSHCVTSESRVLDWLTSVAPITSCKISFTSCIPHKYSWMNTKWEEMKLRHSQSNSNRVKILLNFVTCHLLKDDFSDFLKKRKAPSLQCQHESNRLLIQALLMCISFTRSSPSHLGMLRIQLTQIASPTRTDSVPALLIYVSPGLSTNSHTWWVLRKDMLDAGTED